MFFYFIHFFYFILFQFIPFHLFPLILFYFVKTSFQKKGKKKKKEPAVKPLTVCVDSCSLLHKNAVFPEWVDVQMANPTSPSHLSPKLMCVCVCVCVSE